MDDATLIEAASEARDRAYAPYTGFRMGAAVWTGSQVVTGSLVENVSLGLAMCAERVALFTTASTGERPEVLALVSPPTDGTLTFPCGACLQVALELGGPDLRIIAVSTDGRREEARLDQLLPSGPRKNAQPSRSAR